MQVIFCHEYRKILEPIQTWYFPLKQSKKNKSLLRRHSNKNSILMSLICRCAGKMSKEKLSKGKISKEKNVERKNAKEETCWKVNMEVEECSNRKISKMMMSPINCDSNHV